MDARPFRILTEDCRDALRDLPDCSIDAVVTFAAAQTRPSAVVASAGITVPALVGVGSLVRIVRPETTRRMYAAVAASATFASITGGWHCGFLDSRSVGGLGCDSGSIPRAAQLALVRTLFGDWLDTTLKGAAPRPVPPGVLVE